MATILTIDRSPFVLRMVNRYLAPYKVEHVRVSDAAEGVAVAHQRPLDLIIFGFDSPDGSDRSAVTALRTHPATKNVPVVLVLNEASKALLELADLGVAGFIVKPFTQDAFDRVIGSLISSAAAAVVPERVVAPERTAALAHNDSRATLARLSPTRELPAFPGTVTAALNIARDPDAQIEELCHAIQRDIGIATRVLRIANSGTFARRTTCNSLRDAVTTIGMTTIQDVLSAAALRSLIEHGKPALERLWNHALAVALASEEVLAVGGLGRRGTAFLSGLFHDAGRIVLALTDPAGYEELEALQLPPASDTRSAEFSWYGFDHGGIGATLAAGWGLPPNLCEAIQWHHAPAEAPKTLAMARVLAEADRLVYEFDLGATPVPVERLSESPLLTAELRATCTERFQATWASEQATFG